MRLAARSDEFHERAMQATGLADFGPDDYRDRMQRLLADYDAHARFTPVGLQMIETNITGLLIGRLLAEHGFRTQTTRAEISKPIVIVGMMRTGTTALQRLLAQDPGNQWLPPWLAAAPMPRPPRESWESNPAFQSVAAGLEQLYAMVPGFRETHPMQAGEPDECRLTMDQSFWSPGSACIASAPDYAAWCVATDARHAYRRHRRVLELIAAGDARRWVLKDPCHLWGLDALLAEFPDACIVFMHRDPVQSLTGAAALLHAVRSRTEQLTQEEIGREEFTVWSRALAKAEAVRAQHDPARFLDVHMDELRADPVGIAERIHAHFGLPVSARARDRWLAFTRTPPDGGHARSRHEPEEFGFTADEAWAAVGDYAERYRRVTASMHALDEKKLA